MPVLTSFWKPLVAWTLAIALGLVFVSSATGAGLSALASAPAWLGLAFVLACYPAGIAVSDSVFRQGGVDLYRLGMFAAAAASATVFAFGLANGLAPALLDPGAGPFADTAGLTLAEMQARLQTLGAQAAETPATIEAWLPFNDLAYRYVRRTDGMLLPALFAGVGLLTGHWSGRVGRPDARRTLEWGLGAFLLIATYLAGENGYEMIVTRAAGPAGFAGDLVLIVPGTLVVGLGLATSADLLRTPRDGVDLGSS